MTTQAVAERLASHPLLKGRRLLGIDVGCLLRAGLTGLACGGVQLALLDLFIALGWEPALANTAAFLLSAQLNFALSTLFIWGDRPAGSGGLRRLDARWIAFHGSVLMAAALNLVVFQVARQFVLPLVAAALGIASTTLLNFILQDRFVFRSIAN